MFFQSIEFYVISAVVAAAIVALAVRPPGVGPVRTRLISPDIKPCHDADAPRLIIACDDHANLTITRTGITDVSDVKVAVTVKGYDISIEESAIPVGQRASPDVFSATFMIDFVGRDRYHLSYTAARHSLFAAVAFTVAPGFYLSKPLTLS